MNSSLTVGTVGKTAGNGLIGKRLMRRAIFSFPFTLLVLAGLLPSRNCPAQTVEKILFGITNNWRYNQTTSYNGVNWTVPAFNDASLPTGRGVLALEDVNNSFVTSRTNTVLTLGRLTYYFRTHFTFTNNSGGVALTFSNIVDDGAVYYLNGVEISRFSMTNALTPVVYATLATGHEATAFEVFTLSGPVVETNLVDGDNVLAVEVHQTTAGSSDIVFGLALSATVVDTNPPSTLRMPQTPPSFGYKLTNAFGSLTFTDPLAIVTPPGETNRIFVVEQAGRIAVITNLAAPNRSVFLDISSRTVSGGENGLLGLAFDPGYASNRYFYVFYSLFSTTPGIANGTLHQRLSRFQVSTTNANIADTNEIVLINQNDEAGNHNGGDLHFGPDGHLYVSLGDEGNQNDNFNNSQRIDKDFFSSILRLQVDTRPGGLVPNPHPSNTNNPTGTNHYRIPADNPFIGATNFNGVAVTPASVRTEIYAAGMRNPWRFSFDPVTGLLYCGDVGGNNWEEVDIIVKGGNYGWAFREGAHAGPKSAQAPAGFTSIDPIQEYGHGSATNQGNSITGGVVYRGGLLPELYGAYLFADYASGNVWMLRYDGTNTVPFTRITGDAGIAAFGIDPRNRDVLTADLSEDTIKRLVYDTSSVAGAALPPTLHDTGAFTNLNSLTNQTQSLTPNVGVVPYDINVPFWSDNAAKSRWFFRPGTNFTTGFSRDSNWLFPTGMIWVKHFDLELTNGVPTSARRLETRLLVKNQGGSYGVTYRWGSSLTNATLVPDAGLDEPFVINDGGNLRTQIWHYPSRSECLTCHGSVNGYAAGFNTAQLNRDYHHGTGATNQIRAFSQSGLFNAPVTNLNLLPALAHPTNTAWSLEWRARSYLAANCLQCHQPGGLGAGGWDARVINPLSAAGLVNGVLNNNYGDAANLVIKPGLLTNSMILTRLAMRGPGQMPPLDTSVVDEQGVALLAAWITNALPAYQTYPQWQLAHFASTNGPGTGPAEDYDQDRAKNFLEYLTHTSPLLAEEKWGVSIQHNGNGVQVVLPRVAGRGFEVQWTADLFDTNSWRALDVPENRPFFSATGQTSLVPDLVTNAPARYYRIRVYEP